MLFSHHCFSLLPSSPDGGKVSGEVQSNPPQPTPTPSKNKTKTHAPLTRKCSGKKKNSMSAACGNRSLSRFSMQDALDLVRFQEVFFFFFLATAQLRVKAATFQDKTPESFMTFFFFFLSYDISKREGVFHALMAEIFRAAQLLLLYTARKAKSRQQHLSMKISPAKSLLRSVQQHMNASNKQTFRNQSKLLNCITTQ